MEVQEGLDYVTGQPSAPLLGNQPGPEIEKQGKLDWSSADLKTNAYLSMLLLMHG